MIRYYVNIILIVLFFLGACSSDKPSTNTEIKVSDTLPDNKDTTLPDKLQNIYPIDTSAVKPIIEKIEKQIITPGGITIAFTQRNINGDKINKGDVVKIKYNAYLPDGKLFDSSDIIGMALGFYVGIGMSVKGWDEALLYVSVGDKFRLHIPSKLAYGKKGYGKLIPPDADIDFDMEITEKMKPELLDGNLEFYLTLPRNEEKISAAQNKEVTIHYYGWTADGKLFDASYFNGKPYKYVIGKGRAIEGWNIALKKMKRGEKAIIVVPPSLGYGEVGIPELVPPNSTLVYLMELMDVK